MYKLKMQYNAILIKGEITMEFEIECVVNDEELRWFGVEGVDEDDAISTMYANVEGEITEIIDVREVKA